MNHQKNGENFQSKIVQNYRHMGIKNKSLLRVFGAVGFFVVVFVISFLIVFSSKIETDTLNVGTDKLENVSTRLENYFDEIASIANEANYNYYLQNYLIEEKDNEHGYSDLSSGRSMQNFEMSSKLFNAAINSRTDVTSLMVFGKKSLLFHKSIYESWPIVQEYDLYPWYAKAVENSQSSVITGPSSHQFLKGTTEPTVSLSRMIRSYEDGSFLGVILVDLNLNKIGEICESLYTEGEGSICILNQAGEVIYSQSQEKVPEDLLQRLSGNKEKLVSVTMGETEYETISLEFDRADWTLISMTPTESLKQSMYETLKVILVGMLLLLIVLFFTLNFILTRVVKPIILLKGKMDQADEGSLGVRAEIISNDETGALSKSFNHMMGRIELLMDEVVNVQEEKRKYEFQALQAQINPHFLYNTLDSIIWMAEAKNPDVVPMTEALAKLFRISLNKGNEFISIKDEMEHVKNYLIIQSMRYTDKFSYDIQIAEDALDCRTVKLVVQPIVENSIYHGIKKKRGKGEIHIVVWIENEKLLISVKDDGNGMSQEICEAILIKDSSFENSSGSGIGVKNVNERIQLYFGIEYGLSYTSVLGEGTTAMLTLPIIREGGKQ